MEYIHSVKTKGYLTSVDEITMVVEENGLNLDENLFVRELGGRATGTGLCRGEDSSSISCSMGDRKNEMGVSAITIKVNGDNEEQLKYYGDIIFNGFINKYVE